MKLTGWRLRSYPLEIYAGDELIWRGETEKSLGYIHLNVKPVLTNEITIRLKGASKEGDGYALLKLSLKRICGNRDVDIF